MKCKACALACGGSLNCTDGWGNSDAKLVIYLESPGNALAEKLLIWILWKLNLSSEDVWIDYLVKCPLPEKKAKKKDVMEWAGICFSKHKRKKEGIFVLSGEWTAAYAANVKLKEWHGRKEPQSGCWILYNFNYLLMNPAECVDAWRVIYKAAEEAGLSPKMIMDVPMFKFPSKKIR